MTLTAALTAISQGFHVFPVQPGGKLPDFKWPGRPYLIKWPEYVTGNPTTVLKIWADRPTSNVGVACRQSKLIVIDCDMPKTGRETEGTRFEHLARMPGHVDGTDVLRDICRSLGQDYEALLETYTVCTTRGGLHLYFEAPEGHTATQRPLCPGLLDVRGNSGTDGGYVLAAGSSTPAGLYQVEHRAPVLPCPPYLAELTRHRPPAPRTQGPFHRPTGGTMTGLVTKVSTATEGNRSHTLYWAACAAAVDQIPLDRALEDLGHAAGRAGLTDKEAEQTIRSAYRRKS